MVRKVVLLISICFSTFSLPGWSHSDPEELGHHWEVVAYWTEIWIQLAIIGAACAAYLIVTRAAKVLTKWLLSKG